MNDKFPKRIKALKSSLKRLLACPPATPDELPHDIPVKGVYLFSENSNHRYVGRSNSIRRRIRRHTSQCKAWKGASFAFLLARKITGNLKATYKAEGSRPHLMSTPGFVKEFMAAKSKIRRMEVRFVEEQDPVQQALLEIYVADVLETPYNDFDNH